MWARHGGTSTSQQTRWAGGWLVGLVVAGWLDDGWVWWGAGCRTGPGTLGAGYLQPRDRARPGRGPERCWGGAPERLTATADALGPLRYPLWRRAIWIPSGVPGCSCFPPLVAMQADEEDLLIYNWHATFTGLVSWKPLPAASGNAVSYCHGGAAAAKTWLCCSRRLPTLLQGHSCSHRHIGRPQAAVGCTCVGLEVGLQLLKHTLLCHISS